MTASPPPPVAARLVGRSGPGKKSVTISLSDGVTGLAPGVTIRGDTDYWLLQCAAGCEVRVNGTPCTEKILLDGDVLALTDGPHEFRGPHSAAPAARRPRARLLGGGLLLAFLGLLVAFVIWSPFPAAPPPVPAPLAQKSPPTPPPPDLAAARAHYLAAEQLAKTRDLRPENLFLAVQAWRQAADALAALSPKPPLAAIARQRYERGLQELSARLADLRRRIVVARRAGNAPLAATLVAELHALVPDAATAARILAAIAPPADAAPPANANANANAKANAKARPEKTLLPLP